MQRTRPTRPLDALGISEAEERVYEYLLANASATVREVALAQAHSASTAQRLLDAIEAKGLATHSPQQPRRYIAAAPDIAIEALVLRRQEDLHLARARINELKEQTAIHRHGKQEQVVELIVSRDAQRQALDQLQRTAREELLCMTRPPMILNAATAIEQDRDKIRHLKSLSQRCLVDPSFLELPGAIEKLRSDIENGEDARLMPQIPLKMVLADRRIAFVALNPNQSDSAALLIRSSSLLDALHALFEMLWRQAAPISFTPARTLTIAQADAWPNRESEDLVALLAAGLNDKTIAHELGLSLRTLKRRIADLMKRFNARTRFQVAWLAAPRLREEPVASRHPPDSH
jgi:sugar-specific transcriptional regulator TrmB/DNA-binding CsgD family transcriptional regulator